ncbi:MAG TPA: hypothetical protein VFA77_09150, partial [Candidatus Eisenbacteria bacterium]|nr:hypothetical protein [Candidatus Eisenbacteria bacterium]
ISYAYKGALVRNVSLEMLRAFLTNELVRPVRPRTMFDWLRFRSANRNKAAMVPEPAKPEAK